MIEPSDVEHQYSFIYILLIYIIHLVWWNGRRGAGVYNGSGWSSSTSSCHQKSMIMNIMISSRKKN
jgi:hypothetical protein